MVGIRENFMKEGKLAWVLNEGWLTQRLLMLQADWKAGEGINILDKDIRKDHIR